MADEEALKNFSQMQGVAADIYWAERLEEARTRVSFSDELDDLLTPKSLQSLMEYDEEKGDVSLDANGFNMLGLGNERSENGLPGKDSEIKDPLDLCMQRIPDGSYESA